MLDPWLVIGWNTQFWSRDGTNSTKLRKLHNTRSIWNYWEFSSSTHAKINKYAKFDVERFEIELPRGEAASCNLLPPGIDLSTPPLYKPRAVQWLYYRLYLSPEYVLWYESGWVYNNFFDLTSYYLEKTLKLKFSILDLQILQFKVWNEDSNSGWIS